MLPVLPVCYLYTGNTFPFIEYGLVAIVTCYLYIYNLNRKGVVTEGVVVKLLKKTGNR